MKKVMCAKCGGKVKMAKGGKVGSKSTKSFIAGIPNGGPTGPNYQGIDTMKKGGLVKKQNGGAKDEPIYTMGPRKVKKNLRGNFVVKEKGMEFDPRTNEMATVKTRRVIPKNIKPGDVRKDVIRKKTIVTKDALDNLKKGGSTFGMLSVKAGIDKNPKPTAADRIAGAKMKMRKKK